MKKYRKVVVTAIVIIIISIVTGFIYGLNNNYDISSYLENLTVKNNVYVYHLLVLAISLIMTLSLIGIVGNAIIISFESISIGYIVSIFYNNYKLKGLLFGFANIGINKLFYMLILLYLFLTSYIYFNKSIINLTGVKNDSYKSLTVPLIKKYVLITIILVLNDTFIYFFGNNILNNLFNML